MNKIIKFRNQEEKINISKINNFQNFKIFIKQKFNFDDLNSFKMKFQSIYSKEDPIEIDINNGTFNDYKHDQNFKIVIEENNINYYYNNDDFKYEKNNNNNQNYDNFNSINNSEIEFLKQKNNKLEENFKNLYIEHEKLKTDFEKLKNDWENKDKIIKELITFKDETLNIIDELYKKIDFLENSKKNELLHHHKCKNKENIKIKTF